MCGVCDVPDVFATGAASLEGPRADRHRRETPSRRPNGHGAGATSSADGPARRAGRRARDGEVRKAVPAPEPRKAPAGSPVVRCCSTSRVVASQDVCDVARAVGRVEKYTDTVEVLGRSDALYIFV